MNLKVSYVLLVYGNQNTIINILTCKLGQEQLRKCNIEMCTIVSLIIINCHNRKHFTCGHYKMVINRIARNKNIIMARVVFVQLISYYTIIIIVYIIHILQYL